MRKVVTPGEKVYAYCCPFCCQVEILTESEAHKECSNCGTVMIAAEEIATKEIQEKQAEIDKLCGDCGEIKVEAKVKVEPPPHLSPRNLDLPPLPEPKLPENCPQLTRRLPPKNVPAPKKKGRPPKRAAEDKSQRTGDQERCGNCCKAMKAMRDYTCKETCEAVRPGDWCEKYKRGTPID